MQNRCISSLKIEIMAYHALIANNIICTTKRKMGGNTIHQFMLANISKQVDIIMGLLVATRRALPGVLGCPLQTQGLWATEGWSSPHFLLLLAVYSFEHSLLGLQGLGLSLGLHGHSFFLRLRCHVGKDTCGKNDLLHSSEQPITQENQLNSAS